MYQLKHIFQFINSTTEDPESSLVSLDEGMTAEMTLKETYLAQKIEGILKTHFIAIRQVSISPTFYSIFYCTDHNMGVRTLFSGESKIFHWAHWGKACENVHLRKI